MLSMLPALFFTSLSAYMFNDDDDGTASSHGGGGDDVMNDAMKLYHENRYQYYREIENFVAKTQDLLAVDIDNELESMLLR